MCDFSVQWAVQTNWCTAATAKEDNAQSPDLAGAGLTSWKSEFLAE